ncbi:MAG: pentapeptide repeat-containing protein [Turneriella sp.]
MDKPLITRWHHDSFGDFALEVNKLIHIYPKTDLDLYDLRGIVFGALNMRRNIEKQAFVETDFSFCDFSNCNLLNVSFTNCRFERCKFPDLRQWGTVYEYCTFLKSSFQNATLGTGCSYKNCVFEASDLKGKYFNFGLNTNFKNVSFINCKIQSAQICSVTFEDCIFQSQFKSVRFTGRKFAEVFYENDRISYPTTLRDCQFSGSKFDQVEVFYDIEQTRVIWPDAHPIDFNEDRWYYDEE